MGMIPGRMPAAKEHTAREETCALKGRKSPDEPWRKAQPYLRNDIQSQYFKMQLSTWGTAPFRKVQVQSLSQYRTGLNA